MIAFVLRVPGRERGVPSLPGEMGYSLRRGSQTIRQRANGRAVHPRRSVCSTGDCDCAYAYRRRLAKSDGAAPTPVGSALTIHQTEEAHPVGHTKRRLAAEGLTPWTATWGVAVLHAGIPLTVKLSAGTTNPFLYNAVVKLTQMPVIVIVLIWLTQALFGHDIGTLKLLVKTRALLSALLGHRSTASSSPVSRTLRMPLVWLAVCYFDYSLFAWSTHFIDPVVSATLLQMWPLSLMVLMVESTTLRDRRSQDDHFGLVAGCCGRWEELFWYSPAKATDGMTCSEQDSLTHWLGWRSLWLLACWRGLLRGQR